MEEDKERRERLADDPPSREASADKGAPRIIRNKNRELQVCPTGRHSFDADRKRVFLEWFAGTANLSLSAREAGVHYRTVLRHRKDDPDFRADFDEALAQGKVRVKAWLLEAKDDGRTDYDPAAHAPANLTTDSALQLLRDDAQREAAVARAAAGAGRGRGGRPLKAVDMNEVRRQLAVRLRALGVRLDAEPFDTGSRPGSIPAQDEREEQGEDLA